MRLNDIPLEGSDSITPEVIGKIDITQAPTIFTYNELRYSYSPVQGCFVNNLGECLMHNEQKITQVLQVGENQRGRYMICEKENGKPLILPLKGEEGVDVDSIALITKPLPERTLGKIEGVDVYFKKGFGLFTMNHQAILIRGHQIKEVVYIYAEMMLVELMDDAFTYIHLTDNPKIQAIKGGSRNRVKDALSM